MNAAKKDVGGLRASAFFITAITLAAMVTAASAGAAASYVTPQGGGLFDGSSWENACSNLQDAVNASPNPASTIYVKSGIYTNLAAITVSNHPGLTIRGGYEGIGEPGDFTSAPSVVTRSITVTNRIFSCYASTLTLDRVTVSNGLATFGGGLFLTNCVTLITNCTIATNMIVNDAAKGGGIHVAGGSLTLTDSLVKENVDSAYHGSQLGAGLYASKAAVVLSGVTFEKNSLTGYISEYGGALYVNGGTAAVFNCAFRSNSVAAGHSGGEGAFGGAVHANAAVLLTFSNCTFMGNYALLAADPSKSYGSVLNLSNVAQAHIWECVFRDNVLDGVFSPDIWINSTGATSLRNTLLGTGSERGIYKTGSGSLTLTNCLVYRYPGHGIEAVAGQAALANCTLADNGRWGLASAGSTATVLNTLSWGNKTGGLGTNAATVNYSCSQEPHAGAGNLCTNPLWVAGYYLSAAGLGYQPASSPCVNAGSDTAAALGLESRITRTDGAPDADTVDLGYHTTAGIAVSNLVLYVDAVNGNDANTGWDAGSPLKTITRALANAIDDSTIRIATGLYNQASGETFPLVLQDFDLTLKGTNTAGTIVDAGATNRVFTAIGKGRAWFEGLTVTNGTTTPYGGGFYLNLCETTITNCTITDNTLTGGGAAGAGVYVFRGSLTLARSLVRRNGQTTYSSKIFSGGGLYASGAEVLLADTVFDNNALLVYDTGKGGAIYLAGGRAVIRDCEFKTNRVQASYGWAANTVYGGAIYASGVSPLTVSNCRFTRHQLSVPSKLAYGSVLYVDNAASTNLTLVSDCVLTNNSGLTAADDVMTACAGPVMLRNTVIGQGFGRGINHAGPGSLALTNCLIYAQPSNGVMVVTGAVTVVNSTLAHNKGWGLTNAAGLVSLRNCIAWGNTNGGVSANCDLTYTCSQEAPAGAGNTGANPLFAGVASNNFRLAAASPCINAGLNEGWMSPATDLDGKPRIRGRTVDLGAYESPPPKGTLLLVR